MLLDLQAVANVSINKSLGCIALRMVYRIQLFPSISYLAIYVLDNHKLLLWQTVKTQVKCPGL